MPELTIRRAQPADYPRVGEITVAAYVADGLIAPGSTYPELLRDVATRGAAALVLVAEDADGVHGGVTVAPAGCSFAQIARPGEIEVRMLAVEPAARSRGIGERLMRAAVDHAVKSRASRLVLSSQENMRAAHRLYDRLGFSRLPDRDWVPEPGVRLLGFGRDVP